MNKAQLATVRKETSKRLSSMRKRIEDHRMTSIAVRGTAAVVTGAALGEAERRGVGGVVMGVPVRPALGLVLAVGEVFTKGAVSAALGGAAAASLGVYGYEAVQKQTFIAGSGYSHARSRTVV